MIKLIIFDLDGTLVDSLPDITNAINYAVEPYGLGRFTTEKTMGLVGEGLTRLLEKVLGSEHIGIMPDVMKRFLEHYTAHLVDLTKPYPGVAEVLRKLGGYKKAVISNKREGLSRQVLDQLGLGEHFDIILGSDSVAERKPSPRPLLLVMERLLVQPIEAVMVGDSNLDIEAGRAAGVRTIAVSWGYGDKSSKGTADYIIDRMEELPVVLEKINATAG